MDGGADQEASVPRNKREGVIHHRNGIVVEDCRHIFRREFVRRVRDQETGLANGTIAHHNTPASISVYQSQYSSDRDHRLYRRDNHSFVVVGEETWIDVSVGRKGRKAAEAGLLNINRSSI